jgi:uncharacterized repeat protein (TIGR02543 family)
MRFRALPLLVVAVLALVFVAGASALDRTSVDRPDEAVGPQVHLVYAVPSDGPDVALDTSGTLGSWLTGFNGWLAGQTGGTQVRVDTFGGQPDVTFLRLPQSTADLAGSSTTAINLVYSDLLAAGLTDPDKKYLVAIPGVGDPLVCGIGAYTGPLALIFIDHCEGAVSEQFVLGHELFHTLGAVSNCAPHSNGGGHVGDNEDDLMYPYAQPLGVTPVLDPGHDDYWGPPGDDHLPASCPESANVANSDFLTSHPFYRLLVNGSEHGSIQLDHEGDVGQDCTVDAPCNEVVPSGGTYELSPNPDDGYRFAGWTGASCTGEDCTITVNANTTVSANFVADPHLSLSVTGRGRVLVPDLGTSCTKTCDVSFPYQEATSLRAVPAKGWRLAGWGGACSGTAATCSVTLSDDGAASARFAKLPPLCRAHQKSTHAHPCRKR